MSRQFQVFIDLGNEEMRSPEDVAGALRVLAEDVRAKGIDGEHVIRDANGNKVGYAIWCWADKTTQE